MPPSPLLSAAVTPAPSCPDLPAPRAALAAAARVEATAAVSEESGCWCARMLHLAAQLRRLTCSPANFADASSSQTKVIASRAGDLASLAKMLREGTRPLPGLAEGALVAAFIRGVELTMYVKTGATSSRQENASSDVFSRHAAPPNEEDALLMLIASLSAPEARPCAAAIWRLMWTALASLRAGVLRLRLTAPVAGFMDGEIFVTHAGAAGNDDRCHDGASDTDASVLLAAVRERLGDPAGAACAGGCMWALLEALERLPRTGSCVACGASWAWRFAGGSDTVTFSMDEGDEDSPANANVTTAEAADFPVRFLRALERWLLDDAAEVLLKVVPSCLPEEGHTKPDGAASRHEEDSGADAASDPELQLLSQAAAAEEAAGGKAALEGAAVGERLDRAAWWPLLCARLPNAAARVVVVLAVMAMEHRWIWAFPWSAAFRLLLSHALFIVRSAAAPALPAVGAPVASSGTGSQRLHS
eukprot:TRINITY_DN501_c0_g1_i3.p1 TRINITY_DN501_c0_g1~~TRINITY_DN501_c0_g1_i3.p1  ORF type:complete len:475 (-),score=109.10 TRINITY_DN501_c0_g1_i3:333-1757(-)